MTDLIVGIADIKIGQGEQIIKTSLGSCVAVCIYSKEYHAGAMIHYMLPSLEQESSNNLKLAKYGNPGILEMLKQFKSKFKIENSELVAKIFGGAKVLKNITTNIGFCNEKIAREILHEQHIKIIASKTGGEKGYKIDFNLSNGIVLCQVFGENAAEY
ncbi:MAG: chemotaxis protein CheD [Oligoflexia bacterium]|nr:chemotaxis protein CheD [Oligoflexia bacterium]